MIAVDTSALARFLDGTKDRHYFALVDALKRGIASLPPVVVTELLSNASLAFAHRQLILSLPILPLSQGFWQRTGLLRATLLRRGLKAKLADCLIAQSCIDNDAPLRGGAGGVAVREDEVKYRYRRWYSDQHGQEQKNNGGSS